MDGSPQPSNHLSPQPPQAEYLAKAQFARRKEPYDCALIYLALGRKALLVSLFRWAGGGVVWWGGGFTLWWGGGRGEGVV